MQEAKDLHFTENYLPQISKSQEWIRCYIYPPGTNEETQMLSSYGMKQNAMSTTGIYILTTSSAKHRNSRGLSHAVKRGNSFLCCNIWKNKPQPFLKWVKGITLVKVPRKAILQSYQSCIRAGNLPGRCQS